MGAADVTVIGRGTRIRGRVTGAVSLEIQGHVDGEVNVDGDVTIDAQGLVGANVNARRLVVRGAVKGDLTGEEAVLLEEGARVVGDIRAPRVAIAPGALVRGYVQTGGVSGAPRARAASTSAARPAAKPVAAPAKVAAPVKVAAKATTTTIAKTAPVVARTAPIALSGARQGPPPPVVPALKKGAKGALNKKKAH
jgi:cytoskeletal protein CcmA (bactofilin family)